MSLVDRAFAVLGSSRTSALLSALMSAFALGAVFIPQGKLAEDLARYAEIADLSSAAAFGLTDIYRSPWFYLVLVLIAGNALALLLRERFERSAPPPDTAPADAPLRASVHSARPERALDELRAALEPTLGSPGRANVDGAKVELRYDAGSFSRRAPILLHFGFVSMVLGAGLYAIEENGEGGIAHGIFEILDRQTHTTGHFDLVAGEAFTFFQYPTQWMLRDYVPAQGVMGPAVRFDRMGSNNEPPREVWVYLNAPPGFDERHRQDEVAITAVSMGLSSIPGRGLSASSGAPLIALGLALAVLGIFAQAQAAGSLFIRLNGDEVELLAVPESKQRERFERSFQVWKSKVERALASYA
ncbi:MAG: cytochrome c biogenesis protein ResB [Myxococcota bacterium]